MTPMLTPANPRSRGRVPDEIRGAVVELMRAGVPACEAAATYGVHGVSAAKWARAAGVVVRGRGRPANVDPAVVTRVRLALESGAPLTAIAREEGVSREYARDLRDDPSRRREALPGRVEIPQLPEAEWVTPEMRQEHAHVTEIAGLVATALARVGAK